MIGDNTGLVAPHPTGIFEIPDQFLFFGIDTDDRFLPSGKAFPHSTDQAKLQVAFDAPLLRAVSAQSHSFSIGLEGISQFLEHAANPLAADHNSLALEFPGDFAGSLTGPFQSGHGVTGCFVFHQRTDALNDLWSFF